MPVLMFTPLIPDDLDCHRLIHSGWDQRRCCERCHDGKGRIVAAMPFDDRHLALCCAAGWWAKIYRMAEWLVDDTDED